MAALAACAGLAGGWAAAVEGATESARVCAGSGTQTLLTNRQVRVLYEPADPADYVKISACLKDPKSKNRITLLGDNNFSPVYQAPALVLRRDVIAYIHHQCDPPISETDCNSNAGGVITVQQVGRRQRIRVANVVPDSFRRRFSGQAGKLVLSAGLGVAWTSCSGNKVRREPDHVLLQPCRGKDAHNVRVWRYAPGDRKPVLLSDRPGIDPRQLTARNGRVYWREHGVLRSRRLP